MKRIFCTDGGGWSPWLWVAGMVCVVAVVYAPLVLWLGRVSWQVTQLTNGGLLVIFALVMGLQRVWGQVQPLPQLERAGWGWLAAGMMLAGMPRLLPVPAVPVLTLSFCCALGGVVGLVFGQKGMRAVRPALAGLFVFGVVVGWFPTLDWPMRAMAGRYAAELLRSLGVPVELSLVVGGPPQLMLSVEGRHYIVATECNGFGLLVSALLLATMLGVAYRLPWWSRVGLWLVAVPVAVGANFLRIVSICLVAPGVPVSYGLVHEVLGNVFYFGGLGLIWLLARPPATSAPVGGAASEPTSPSDARESRSATRQ